MSSLLYLFTVRTCFHGRDSRNSGSQVSVTMMTPGGRKYKTNYNSENGEEVEMLEIPTKYLLINIETTIVFFFLDKQLL